MICKKVNTPTSIQKVSTLFHLTIASCPGSSQILIKALLSLPSSQKGGGGGGGGDGAIGCSPLVQQYYLQHFCSVLGKDDLPELFETNCLHSKHDQVTHHYTQAHTNKCC